MSLFKIILWRKCWH